MGLTFLLFILPVLLSSSFSSSSPPHNVTKGSSLSVEKTNDVLISRNRVFSAGFHQVGKNAFCFAIWFTQKNDTIVWMANRDQPVNGKRSKLTLLNSGNLVLMDAGQFSVWTTQIDGFYSWVHLQLNDNGDLVLQTLEGKFLWRSFDSPTDTLLPHQVLTGKKALISSRSQTDHSSGSYKLFFDDDNVLRLVFSGHKAASVYWPDPGLEAYKANRSTYNNTRTALLDSFGNFSSSDRFNFSTADYGLGPQRRLTMDSDGDIRVYSLDEEKVWQVQWQHDFQACRNHGICGENSLCHPDLFGRRCYCIPGYKMKNTTDWAYGCEPEFKTCEDGGKDGFIRLPHVEFWGYDSEYFENYTLHRCQNLCLKECSCIGIQYKFDELKGYFLCYTKNRLRNGYKSTWFKDPMYIKVPRRYLNSSQKSVQEFNLQCSQNGFVELDRNYEKKHENGAVKFMLWFAYGLGGFEVLSIIFFCYKTQQPSNKNTGAQSYLQVATGFTRFSYADLKKASHNFSEEIGRGGGGVVYKAVFSDRRIAAIKVLNEANQGEPEFLAEMSLIGRLNHVNLIEIWGYCADGKHRLLVYEYMENGSLAEKLYSNTLDWEKRYDIALGTAKGLAYLHDECLEWVLHCDVKPQNILLDSNYEPKVADFGLSKLLNRGGIGNSGFSKIRGTRGYMAPEWIFNLSISSKVDVYSYGIVILELITGRSPTGETDHPGLVTWVREKKNLATGSGRGSSWFEEIVDPTINGYYDMGNMEVLVQVGMQCVQEEKDARPTMSQVVDMLLHGKTDYY